MATTKAKPRNGASHRTINPRGLPLAEIFEPWELIDWGKINANVGSGKAAYIESAYDDDANNWAGCALRELGRQNVYVTFRHVNGTDDSGGLWIIPRKNLTDVLLEQYERLYV